MLHILVSNSTYERTDILGACQDNFVSPKHITTTEATSPLVLYNSTVTYSPEKSKFAIFIIYQANVLPTADTWLAIQYMT